MMEPKQALLLVMETRFMSGGVHREPMMVFAKEDEMRARQKAQEVGEQLKRAQLNQGVMQMLGMAQVGVSIQVVAFMDGGLIRVATEMPALVKP